MLTLGPRAMYHRIGLKTFLEQDARSIWFALWFCRNKLHTGDGWSHRLKIKKAISSWVLQAETLCACMQSSWRLVLWWGQVDWVFIHLLLGTGWLYIQFGVHRTVLERWLQNVPMWTWKSNLACCSPGCESEIHGLLKLPKHTAVSQMKS